MYLGYPNICVFANTLKALVTCRYSSKFNISFFISLSLCQQVLPNMKRAYFNHMDCIIFFLEVQEFSFY